VVLTATDGDGDSKSSKVDLGHHIQFEDDGPKADLITISIDKGGDGKLVHDETAGVQNNGNTPTDPDHSGEDEDDVAGPLTQFNGLGLSALGFASTTVTIDLSGGGANPNAAYGSDGPGTASIALTNASGGAFTGEQTNLRDTETTDFIFL